MQIMNKQFTLYVRTYHKQTHTRRRSHVRTLLHTILCVFVETDHVHCTLKGVSFAQLFYLDIRRLKIPEHFQISFFFQPVLPILSAWGGGGAEALLFNRSFVSIRPLCAYIGLVIFIQFPSKIQSCR